MEFLPVRRVLFSLISAAAGVAVIVFPASATPALSPTFSLPVVCFDPVACVQVTDYGSGQGILAISKKNSAITGTTLKALANDPGDSTGIGGIVGLDLAPLASGQSNGYEAGVFGRSLNGEGVLAVSQNWNGIVGVTFNNGLTTGNFTNGLVGLDSSSDNSGFNNGMLGVASSGYGGVFITQNPSLTTGFSSIGVLGTDGSSDGGVLNVGVEAFSSGTGLLSASFAPQESAGSAQYPAIEALCLGGGPALVAASGTHQPADDIMSLDCAGNMTLSGTLTMNGVPLSATKTASGAVVTTFPARQAQPTIEDVGQAQLIGGLAAVRIEPVFASAMDQHANYIVLLTPEGDSRGLYVTQKTPSSFVVRESQGGRSSLTFSYRIVAKPFDTVAMRLPAAGSVHQAAPRPASTTKAQVLKALAGRALRAAAPYLHRTH